MTLEVNLNKTEIIVFRNGGYLRNNETWYFGDTPVKVVSKYKYMGVHLTSTLSWSFTHEQLAIQARKDSLTIKKYEKPFDIFQLMSILNYSIQ